MATPGLNSSSSSVLPSLFLSPISYSYLLAYFLVLSPHALAFVLGDLCMGARHGSESALSHQWHMATYFSSLLILTLILRHLVLERTLSPARQHGQREGYEGSSSNYKVAPCSEPQDGCVRDSGPQMFAARVSGSLCGLCPLKTASLVEIWWWLQGHRLLGFIPAIFPPWLTHFWCVFPSLPLLRLLLL